MRDEAVSRNFLSELVRPESPDLDIVAVHGLNPWDSEFHAEQTWTAEGKLWLKHFLPERLPRTRVLLFGYNSNVAFKTSVSGVREQAENLLAHLRLARGEAPNRPLLFVCHSLGGIVVKRALVDATLNIQFQDIRRATYGIVFFGTPHQGGNHTKLGSIASTIVRAVLRQPSNSFLKALERDSLFADDLVRDFRHQLEDYRILSFYESSPYGKLGIIVDRKSATLGLPGTREQQIDTGSNHVNMCKFARSDGSDYTLVIGYVAEMANSAVEDHQRLSSAASQNVLSTESAFLDLLKQSISQEMQAVTEPLARQLLDVSRSVQSAQGLLITLTPSHSSRPKMPTATQSELDQAESLVPGAGISESITPQSNSRRIQQGIKAPVGSANHDPSPRGNQTQGLTTYSFASFQGTGNDPENRHHDILERVMKKILEPDLRGTGTGYIYCSITRNRPHLVHIGITSRPPQELELRFRRAVGCHYHGSIVLFHYTSVHYRIVEHLVRTTLRPWLWAVECKGCGFKHLEFFNITPENAAAVVEKWKAWAEMGPYDNGKLEGQWERISIASKEPGDRLQSLLDIIGSAG